MPGMELQTWAYIGSCVWFSPVFLLACLLWGAVSGSILLSYAGACGLALFWVLQLGVLLAHLAVISPHEAHPLQVLVHAA